jgi:hypothetical protein
MRFRGFDRSRIAATGLALGIAVFGIGANCESTVSDKGCNGSSRFGGADVKCGASAAVLTVFPTASETSTKLDFGTIESGDAVEKFLTIKNTGGTTARNMYIAGMTTPVGYTGGGYPGTAGNCAAELGPGESCQLDLMISPTVTAYSSASYTNTLKFKYYDGKDNKSVDFVVEGTAKHCATSTATIDYSSLTPNSTFGISVLTDTYTQGFTFSTAKRVSSVKLPFRMSVAADSVESIKVAIYSQAGNGHPSAVALGSTDVASPGLSTSYSVKTFTFAEPISLEPNAQYYVAVSANGLHLTSSQYLYIGGSTTVGYSEGTVSWSYGIGGAQSAYAGYDLNMSLYTCD